MKNKSFKKFIGCAIALFLFSIFIVYGAVYFDILGLGEKAAIEITRFYCAESGGPEMQESPRNFTAELTSCGQINKTATMRKCKNHPLNARVWLVTAEGLWVIYPPLPADELPATPIQLTKCTVLIDARTGQQLERHWFEKK